MTLDALLRSYAAYNRWANTEWVNWLKTKPLELLEREVPSSFPGIRPTLWHILDVETGWLYDLQGAPVFDLPEDSAEYSLADICSGILEKSAEFAACVEALPAAEFLENCQYPRYDGMMETRPKFEIIQHCLNHSTFHRGQLVTIARNLGLTDIPNTDFMRYLRLQ